jgi:hypothetical protein
VADGVVDEHCGLGGVGEISGDEKDIIGGLDGLAIEEGVARGDEFFDVSGSEDEFGSGATVALGQGEAESTGAAGDEDNLPGAPFWGAQLKGVSCCYGGDSGEEMRGMEDGP